MRPVNLIPPEERRGERAPSRTGALAYIVVGALAVALLGVVGVVLTDNQIADSNAQVAELHGQLTDATAEANRLKSYADFAAMETARNATVSTLANSRFDWYRVLRELALLIPSNVWVTDLQGSVTPEAAVTGSGGSGGSSSTGASAADVTGQITGPSLSISGCASGHDAVAGFIGALRDIDGVTRVVVTQSERSDQTAQAGAATAPSGCAVRSFIAQFQVVVAFDKVPVDATTGLATSAAPTSAAAPTATTAAPAGATTAGPATAATAAAGGAGVRHQEAKQQQSAKQQSDKAHQAVSTLIPGVVRP